MSKPSKNQQRLLLAALDGPVLQSTALRLLFKLPSEGRLRERPGKYYSPQRVGVRRHNSVRTSLTRSLRRLARAGLVVRHKARAAGSASFELTEQGREVAQQLGGVR
jgi:DNA-binding MarR family transcriptional regulator